MRLLLLYLVARWRLYWELCPECNSDAPEMYECDVCHGFRCSDWHHGPPCQEWLGRWFHRRGEEILHPSKKGAK